MGNRSIARGRALRIEALEPRQVLSASPLTLAVSASSSGTESIPSAVAQPMVDHSLAGREAALAISAVHLQVGDRKVTIKSLDELVKVELDEKLQIVGVDYRLAKGAELSGKVAFEAYLNKLHGSKLKTDYSDGRFGGHEQQGQLPEGESSHGGLDGGWAMQAGTESITLVLVRYDQSGAKVEDRVTLRTQVGTPDFAISSRAVVAGRGGALVAGEQARIYGMWANLGAGTYRNYAEVDVYHSSDPNKIVWAGTLSRTLGGKQAVAGEFRNANSDEHFDKRWIPAESGEYVLKFYADPEQNWDEANEGNNVVTMKVKVREALPSYRSANQHQAMVESAPLHQVGLNTSARETRAISPAAHDFWHTLSAPETDAIERFAPAVDTVRAASDVATKSNKPVQVATQAGDRSAANAEAFRSAFDEWSTDLAGI